jgi:hypothetical protein
MRKRKRMMNKAEFIQYIEKIPEDTEFTPMHVDVHGNLPNLDGSYRTITKKIKFECEYTAEVHKLPIVEEKIRGIFDEIDKELDREVSRDLYYEVIWKFEKDHGSNVHQWGIAPLRTLALLLHYGLLNKDESFRQDLYDELGTLKEFIEKS